jgi:hypothetical protein
MPAHSGTSSASGWSVGQAPVPKRHLDEGLGWFLPRRRVLRNCSCGPQGNSEYEKLSELLPRRSWTTQPGVSTPGTGPVAARPEGAPGSNGLRTSKENVIAIPFTARVENEHRLILIVSFLKSEMGAIASGSLAPPTGRVAEMAFLGLKVSNGVTPSSGVINRPKFCLS